MAEPGNARWQIAEDRAAFVAQLVQLIATDIEAAVAERGRARFGASGGSTPAPVYAALAGRGLPWSRLDVVVVDERAVPPSHESSNQRMIAECLVADQPLVHLVGLWSDEPSLEAAAEVAAERVRDLGAPLDVVLLGMGEDGHFASCFAGAACFAQAIDPDATALVLPIAPMPAGVHPAIERLTLTWSYLRRARRIVLAITGARKRAVLLQAMRDQDPDRLPIAVLFRPGSPTIDIHWCA